MIQKYKLTVQVHEDRRTVLLPDDTGEYIKYSDHIRCLEALMDKNFSLQEECLDRQQTKEGLIQVIIGLSNILKKKEGEITAISDRLNKLYLSERANISTAL